MAKGSGERKCIHYRDSLHKFRIPPQMQPTPHHAEYQLLILVHKIFSTNVGEVDATGLDEMKSLGVWCIAH